MYPKRAITSRLHVLPSRTLKPTIERLEARRVLADDLAPLLDINTNGAGTTPTNPLAVGTSIFYIGSTATTGRELWKSDGSAAGTVMLKDIFGGGSDGNPSYLTNVNGTVFFTANDGTTGAEL